MHHIMCSSTIKIYFIEQKKKRKSYYKDWLKYSLLLSTLLYPIYGSRMRNMYGNITVEKTENILKHR